MQHGPATRIRVLPQAFDAQVWIDFDGTITRKDVLDELILAFAADDSWRSVEADWQAGRIGSYECLSAEFQVLRVTPERLEPFLREIPIDPGTEALFALLARWNVPVAVLSDGVESFIRAILHRAKVPPLTVRANRIEHVADRLRLACPHRHDGCRSRAAHCKCASIDALGRPALRSIYVGDGRSDLCPARGADVVFAKGALARLLESEGKPFIPFETLYDVEHALTAAWAGKTSAV